MTASQQAACAHLNIVREQREESGRVTGEWWECGGCHMRFLPEFAASVSVTELAQARQQAVAECAEIAESNQRRELEHRKYGHELRGAAACKIIADEIRSLSGCRDAAEEARQQAIVDCAALFHAPEIKQRILDSLTPPPALTKEK